MIGTLINFFTNMKTVSVYLSMVLGVVLALHIFSTGAFAKTYSYKLFDPMVVPQPSVVGGGRIAWWKEYSFDAGIMNHGGRMVISKNPDGTGDARVGDTLQIWANNPAHGSYIYTYNAHRPNCFFEDPPAMPPQDITSYFPVVNDPYSVTVRILDWCGKEKTTDSLYLVNITNEGGIPPQAGPTVTPSLTPTIVPSATPAPTAIPVAPFLDLPWDYKSGGLSFTDAALSIEAFFDHAYPLLSAGLAEEGSESDTVVKFDGSRSHDPYSSHDGYDYAKRAAAVLGEPVLAAAAGKATYVNTCPACGNMITIDHGNGYQTRYMHLLKEGLITQTPGITINVKARQPIGKIGFTGNVIPQGDLGAHIHFMVVQDKNNNGDFEDNIPNGITDPFGWGGTYADPWNREGNMSRYLWKNKLDTSSGVVTPQNVSVVSLPHFTATFPIGILGETFFTQVSTKPSSETDTALSVIGNTFALSAVNQANQIVTQFQKAFTIRIDFKKTDVASVKPETLSIYSSQDGETWIKEPSTVNIKNSYATATPNHMTYFALLGERKDTVAPVTSISVKGKLGEDKWYHGRIKVTLKATDNHGSGVDYTTYQINDGERIQYKSPFVISNEGKYKIKFFSVDRDSNVEREQMEFYKVRGRALSKKR